MQSMSNSTFKMLPPFIRIIRKLLTTTASCTRIILTRFPNLPWCSYLPFFHYLQLERVASFRSLYLNFVIGFDGYPNKLAIYVGIWKTILNDFHNHTNPDIFHNVYLLNYLNSKYTKYI